jgi:hypothetical protein
VTSEACSTYGKDVCRVLVRTPQGKRLLRSPRRRWEYNIKMDDRKIGCSMDWTDVARDRERW